MQIEDELIHFFATLGEQLKKNKSIIAKDISDALLGTKNMQWSIKPSVSPSNSKFFNTLFEEKSKLINIIRTDVSAYYESDKLLKTGFLIDFTAPTTVNTVQVQVMLKNTKVWVTVFDQQLLANRISIPSDISKVNDHIPGMVVVDDFYTYLEHFYLHHNDASNNIPEIIRDLKLSNNFFH